MKKFLKVIFILLLVLVGLFFALFKVLNSSSALDKIAKTAIEKTGLDVGYSSLEGGLFDGLEIKGFSYEKSVKADLKLKADFNALKDKVLHIEDINISNLWIDEEYLKTLLGDSNSTKKEKKSSSMALKKLIVDSATLNLVDFHYGEYVVDRVDIQIDDLLYDMREKIEANIKADIKSNVTDALIKAEIKDENYSFDIDALPKKAYIEKFTKDQNITIKKAPRVTMVGSGDFHKVDAKVNLTAMALNYNDIEITPNDITLDALYDIDKKDVDAKLLADVDSLVATLKLDSKAKLNIEDLNNTLEFKSDAIVTPKGDYLQKLASESNITIEKLSTLDIHADGNFENINFKVRTNDGKFLLKDMVINPKTIDLVGSYSLNSGDLKSKILTDVLSNVANFDIDGDVSLNSNDINNTLSINLTSHLNSHKKYFAKMLKEQNITIKKMPSFLVTLKGDFKKIDLKANLSESSFLYKKSTVIEPKETLVDASYSLKSGELKSTIDSDIVSDVANLNLQALLSANTNDINNTLKYRSNLAIIAQKREIKDLNLTITKPTHVKLNIKGDGKLAHAMLDANGALVYEKLKIKPRIYDTKIDIDLKTKKVDAKVFADIFSTVGKLKTDAIVSVDLDDINNTLLYTANLYIKDAKPYKGVDLSSLGDIKAYAKGSLKKLDARVTSPKIKAYVKSSDFDKFDIDVDSKKIYIGKIYRYVPKELEKSFVAIKSKGYYRLSQKEAMFKTKLKGLKYAGKVISTKEFVFRMKGDDINLENFALLGDDFDMGIKFEKVGDKIRAKLENPAINGYADFNMKPLYVDAKLKINSIAKLIKEINKVYPLQVGINVDGPLDVVASMEGEDVRISLNSPKIKFDDGDMVDVNILGFYNPHRVLVKNFDFELKGFEPKEFNRKVKLKRDALITLDKETNSIDIALENLLEFKGTQKGDVATGKLSAKNLMIAYRDYGSTKITSELDMFQSAKQLAVTGFVEFSDTEITYESPFLDVSKDPDIIVITRADKGKKPPSDNFLKDTFLDISVKSKDEMLYDVDAGEIEFSPDIKIRKDFGYLPKITGKIKVLDGQYDVADKRFQVKEGAIAFRGQEGSNPLLDLHVEYEIEDVVIMIGIGGDKNRPKLKFESKPMMSKKDIFSYLLFGMSASETEGAATSANKAAEKIFGRAVAKDLARELHLDRLDMNRNSLGGIDIKAGKKLNKKSILYYQNKSNASSVIYERKLSKKWSIETEVGKEGQGVDIFYRKGYK